MCLDHRCHGRSPGQAVYHRKGHRAGPYREVRVWPEDRLRREERERSVCSDWTGFYLSCSYWAGVFRLEGISHQLAWGLALANVASETRTKLACGLANVSLLNATKLFTFCWERFTAHCNEPECIWFGISGSKHRDNELDRWYIVYLFPLCIKTTWKHFSTDFFFFLFLCKHAYSCKMKCALINNYRLPTKLFNEAWRVFIVV